MLATHEPQPNNPYQVIYRWALFLPSLSVSNEDNGVERSKGKGKGHWVNIDIVSSQPAPFFSTNDTLVNELQVRESSKRVYTRKGFEIFGSKDQMFCVDVVKELHRMAPESVPASAVEDVMKPAKEMSNRFRRGTVVRPQHGRRTQDLIV